MRIIVTNNGVQEISSLSGSQSEKNLLFDSKKIDEIFSSKELSIVKNNSSSHIFPKKRVPFLKKNVVSSLPVLTKGSNNSSLTLSASKSKVPVKNIKILQQKLSIPKPQSDQYYLDKSTKNLIVKQVPDVLATLSIDEKMNLNKNKRSAYLLKDILSRNCREDLNNQIKNEAEVSFYNKKIDHIYQTNLRKEKTESKFYQEKEKEKNTLINSSNSSLIEYLSQKETLGSKTLSKISHYEESKLGQLNRICQKILMKKDDENLLQLSIKEKINQKTKNEKVRLVKNMSQIGRSINLSKLTLDDLKFKTLKEQREEIYREVHHDFAKKYWSSKNNYERFFHPLKEEKKKKKKVCNRTVLMNMIPKPPKKTNNQEFKNLEDIFLKH